MILAFILPFSYAINPSFSDNGSKLIFSNGYVYLEFDKSNPCIDLIKGDFSGAGVYGGNLVATNSDGRQGIILETVTAAGVLNKSSKSNSAITYAIVQNDTNKVKVRISGIKDAASGNIATSTWVISLDANSRKFTLETSTSVTSTQALKAIKISCYLQQWCVMGLYKNGIVQYVQNGTNFFSSSDTLRAFYTMDNSAGSLAIVPLSAAGGVVESNLVTNSSLFKTGLEQVLAGSYPVKNSWNTSGWGSASNVIISAGTNYTANFDIFPNQYAFPTHMVKSGANIDFSNLRTIYTAVYGSAAGCLGSYLRSGSAYPTLASPTRAYGENYTFFDPDAWSTVATLSFSGDPYLENEARKILELSESTMNTNGQIPHHFDAGTPTYVALSGASQTGPNIFWLLASIDYITGTGNSAWLISHYNNLKKAVDWLLGFYDPARKLLKVNGPLWIDVFIRNNYTFDSNVFMLRLLTLMASVSTYCGDPASAAIYIQRVQDIKTGLESLWAGTDHYITYRGANWTTTKDMVDYDNYSAIAWKATTDSSRIKAMYSRLDNGANTHPGGKGTWVSEVYYGTSDCYNGNTGDSRCAMGRLWWVDMIGRYVTGDSTNFYTYYSNIRNDLLNNTWLTERYDASGNLIRAGYYHEYPEILSMLMREQIYGIDVKLDTVTIKPFKVSVYNYNIGNLAVSYNKNNVSLSIPGSGTRIFKIYGLVPNSSYAISTGGTVMTNNNGVAIFPATIGSLVTLSIITVIKDGSPISLPLDGREFLVTVANGSNFSGAKFILERGEIVRKVYITNITGRVVQTLYDGNNSLMVPFRVVWNGRAAAGGSAASGIYIAKVCTNHAEKNVSLLLIR